MEKLESSLSNLLSNHKMKSNISLEKCVFSKKDMRIKLERVCEEGKRYVLIGKIFTKSPHRIRKYDYMLTGGRYQTKDPYWSFDGKRFGSLEYMVKSVKMWLIDLCEWDDIVPEGWTKDDWLKEREKYSK
jgi:hypothetical protein